VKANNTDPLFRTKGETKRHRQH